MAFTAVQKDVNGIPIGEVYPPGSSGNSVALQGSVIVTTDAASNQSAPAAFHHASGTVATAASTAITSTPVTNGPYTVGPYAELAVDVNLTAKTGTSPTIQFFIDRIGADGIAYNIWSSSVVSTTPAQVSASIGSGFSTNQSFGSTIQFRWVIGGSGSPGFTFSYSIIGK
jgi:hypothetical protein